MKTVLLIGDSIRESYQEGVKKLLDGEVVVLAPGENCRYTKYALWGMHAWMEALGNPNVDIIHWNTGIWDHHRVTADGLPFTSLEEYAFYTERLYTQMNSYTHNLIWATTTPANSHLKLRKDWSPAVCDPANGPFTFERWNQEVELYNKTACEILSAKGNVLINDLYSLVLPRLDDYICDDGVHPTPEGAEALAAQVAEHIRRLL